METSGRLGLPYLAAGQMQKHVTVNAALTRLDVLVQCRAASRSAATAPADPPEGELHILAEGAATGAWAAFTPGDLVRAEPGGWVRETTPEGLVVLVADEGVVLIRHDGGWRGLGTRLGELQELARLGLNTRADAANPLAARVAKALFAAPGGEGGGDLRFTLNKEASSDVLSLLFQSGWRGRAEIGLVGDDDLVLKVADDEGGWREALRVDRQTGRADFPAGAGRRQEFILTEDGVWSPPAWARRVEARITAGGGGGGSGAAGAGGTARFGGGGGGGGGLAGAVWSAADLSGGLTLGIGAGGEGGVSASAGADGGATTVSIDGRVRLRALGGRGGRGGTTTEGASGAGGRGVDPANDGGASRVLAAGDAADGWKRPDGPGGGGGGGGLDATGTARPGGAGGDGAVIGAAVQGGAGATGAGGHGAGADDLWPWAGGGGGGGGASTSGAGHGGGDGGPGAGGGGGGAGGLSSGAGGRGGDGRVVLTAVG